MRPSPIAEILCSLPWGATTTSPGLSSKICYPRIWARPRPSVMYRVCPPSWECQALRALGVKRTAATFS